MEMTEQLTELAQNKEADKDVFIQSGENKIPVRFKRGDEGARALIVSFHGAVDRKTRKVPAFVPWFPGLETYAHQLSISDPSILDYHDISIAWYAGSEKFSLQSQLIRILDDFATILNVSKLIFFGTSGGGFAALYNTWHSKHSFSMSIVGNPQTDVANYYEKHIQNYSNSCWPSMKSKDEMFQHFDYEVNSLFEKRFSRSVIYIQSTADEFHLLNHMTPFLGSTASHKAARLILDVGFWGRFGHSPSFEAYIPWIRSALLAPTTKKNDILKARLALDSSSLSDENNPLARRVNRDGFEVGDLNVANMVGNWLFSH